MANRICTLYEVSEWASNGGIWTIAYIEGFLRDYDDLLSQSTAQDLSRIVTSHNFELFKRQNYLIGL